MTSRLYRIASDLWNAAAQPDALPVVYYSKHSNVGDLLNPYMLPKLTGRPVFQSKSDVGRHIRAVGSVLGSASARSFIWGSGSIDGLRPRKAINPARIFALRGERTLALCRDRFALDTAVPLGDPAILMPDLYDPVVKTRFNFGVVPHFLDFEVAQNLAKNRSDLTVVDVRKNPEEFVRDLKQCRRIMSSSLHGLILADAYGIPNLWVKFRKVLMGDQFKFQDYLSMTDRPASKRLDVLDEKDLDQAIDRLGVDGEVRTYTGDRGDLLESLARLVREFEEG
jgi:pyruvyltransferase